MQNLTYVGFLAAQKEFRIDVEFILRAPAPEGHFLAVLESDGETGYFYAFDSSRSQPFQDGCLIWSQESAVDKPYAAKIYWSEDNLKVLLTINDYPNSVFDFSSKTGCCRLGVPDRFGQSWSPAGHVWQESMMKDFLPPPPPTLWEPLLEALDSQHSIDAKVENFPESLIIETSPTHYLGSGERVLALFHALNTHIPAGAGYAFFNQGPNLIIIASSNNAFRDRLVEQRGYESYPTY